MYPNYLKVPFCLWQSILKKGLVFFFLTVLSIGEAFSQNLDDIGKSNPFKVNGGVSVNQIFYSALGRQTNRDPYNYYLSGNLNFSIYDLSVPLSYTYSNQQGSFQQPFNQYGLHPKYKWITAHLGYASMTFSPYTLNGHQFLGAGIELEPGSKFRFSAMYGRLRKAIEYDTSNINMEPAYQRIGYGMKAGINLGIASFEIISFHSKDQLNSLKGITDSLEVYPEENQAYGFTSQFSVIENLKVNVELGKSFITRDIRSPEVSDNVFYNQNITTEQFNALKAGVKYTGSFYSAGVNYERIDPGYRTHGSYYFNNDLENIAANITASLLNRKLNLGANVGVQHDDLDNKKASNMLRVVSAFNAGYVPTDKLNINATYSNFRSHTNIKSQFEKINALTPYENLDTLNFTQISANTSINISYALTSNEKNRQNLGLNVTYQQASEYQQQVMTNNGAKFLSLNASHNYTLVKTNLSFTSSFNYSNSSTQALNSYTMGPTLSIRKSFFKNKLRTTLSSSYNNSYSNRERVSSIYNFRVNGGYSVAKKHNFNLSGALISRAMLVGSKGKFTEFTVTMGYNYNF